MHYGADHPPAQRTPRVSVAVPVYNGERYLRRTLDSILAQTFTDFELIITDNASTDATADICRELAARDPRIRYHRADENRGISDNFRWAFELARGEYFKWNAADDYIAPTYLQRCIRVLEEDREVVLAFTRTLIVDDNDRLIRENEYDAEADVASPSVRFHRLMNIDHRRHGAHELWGVMRRAELARIPIYERVVRADSIMLARLALLGRFRRVEEPLFFNREHVQRSVARQTPGRRMQTRSRLSRLIGQGPVPPASWWNPALKGRIVFPEWRILGEYLKSTRYANLTVAQALACQLRVALFGVRILPKLARDVIIALEHLLLGDPAASSPPAPPAPQIGASSAST
jgi:glycosyltransferase involved in cell wall biosynthesis